MSQATASRTVSVAEELLDGCLERLHHSVKLPVPPQPPSSDFVNTFEAYIKPNKLLTQDYTVKTNIAHIATKVTPRDFKFDTLPTDKLKDILVLKAPRVVATQNYVRFQAPSSSAAPPAKRVKILPKSSSSSNLTPATTTNANITATLPASSSSSNLAAVPPPVAAKPPSFTLNIPAKASSSKPMPDNFYEVVRPFFDREFFEVEYDDIKVNCAFFARITYSNCKDYGLELFAPDPMNFDIIHEKLAKKQFRSLDEFLSNFRTVLNNIATYFPMEHPARKEVDVVRDKFDSKWPTVAPRFKW